MSNPNFRSCPIRSTSHKNDILIIGDKNFLIHIAIIYLAYYEIKNINSLKRNDTKTILNQYYEYQITIIKLYQSIFVRF